MGSMGSTYIRPMDPSWIPIDFHQVPCHTLALFPSLMQATSKVPESPVICAKQVWKLNLHGILYIHMYYMYIDYINNINRYDIPVICSLCVYLRIVRMYTSSVTARGFVPRHLGRQRKQRRYQLAPLAVSYPVQGFEQFLWVATTPGLCKNQQPRWGVFLLRLQRFNLAQSRQASIIKSCQASKKRVLTASACLASSSLRASASRRARSHSWTWLAIVAIACLQIDRQEHRRNALELDQKTRPHV